MTGESHSGAERNARRLRRSRLTCERTVCSESTSSTAIRPSVRPSATSDITSRSRLGQQRRRAPSPATKIDAAGCAVSWRGEKSRSKTGLRCKVVWLMGLVGVPARSRRAGASACWASAPCDRFGRDPAADRAWRDRAALSCPRGRLRRRRRAHCRVARATARTAIPCHVALNVLAARRARALNPFRRRSGRRRPARGEEHVSRRPARDT